MSEEKNKAPNLLQRRVSGAVKPKEEFKEAPVETSNSASTADTSIRKTISTGRKLDNQQKSIKISEETSKDLTVLKSMENIKFDYEIIQMLIDQYTSTLSDADMRRYTVLRENL